MIIEDYSCAKAHFVKKGEEPEIVWAWLTGMFDKAEKKVPSGTRVKSFIAESYPLMSFQKGYVNSSREGDVFKYDNTGGPGSTSYVKIEEWQPYTTFTFTETYAPSPPSRNVGILVAKYPPITMKVSLEKHPEGTMVIIERIEVVLRAWKEKRADKLKGRFDENTSVGRLAFILDYPNFPEGSSYIDDTYTIVRDDSLKNKLPKYSRYEG